MKKLAKRPDTVTFIQGFLFKKMKAEWKLRYFRLFVGKNQMTFSKYVLPFSALLILNACAQDRVVVEENYYADDFEVVPPTTPAVPDVPEREPAVEEKELTEPVVAETTVSTSSYIGQKIDTIRREVNQLREKVNKNADMFKTLKDNSSMDSTKYYEDIAFINARLQNGTTQGNPQLYQRWRDAVGQIDLLERNVTAMAGLATQISNDSDMVTYLLNAVRSTFAISGAIDEEHEALKKMEDEVNQIAVSVERLKGELNTQIARQQQYVINERRNTTTLAMAIREGQLFGVNLSDPTMIPTAAVAPTVLTDSQIPVFKDQGRRPLVRIPFDKQKVAYEQPLYHAVKAALAKRPDVVFELVAVSAVSEKSNYDAIKNAEAVLHSLIEMGLPAGRVNLAKMQSKTAKNNEVHLYIK